MKNISFLFYIKIVLRFKKNRLISIFSQHLTPETNVERVSNPFYIQADAERGNEKNLFYFINPSTLGSHSTRSGIYVIIISTAICIPIKGSTALDT